MLHMMAKNNIRVLMSLLNYVRRIHCLTIFAPYKMLHSLNHWPHYISISSYKDYKLYILKVFATEISNVKIFLLDLIGNLKLQILVLQR